MAFVGHPILADIRKGFRLRPTQTVDKSKPIIRAEGEQLSELLQNRSPSPVSPPQAKSNGMPKGTKAPPPPPMTHWTNEAKRNRQTETAKPSPKSISGQSVSADHRQKMLAQIRAGGVRLRHVQTMDKSGLILDEQQKQEQNYAEGTRNGTTSPQSLDSQGKSPSPRTTPSSSSASAFSPTPISAGNSIDCWHRTLSDDSSDSVPLGNGCVPTNDKMSHQNYPTGLLQHHFEQHYYSNRNSQQQQKPPSPPEHYSFAVRPPSVTSNLAIGQMPSLIPAEKWNQQQGTTVIRVGETAPSRGNVGTDQSQQKPKGNSDFQFDEQKQISERREEVASLCEKRSASAKIVAFRKLQQRHQQQTESVASSYCTLPRKTKAQTHKHWHAKVASSDGCAATLPSAHCAVPTFAVETNERHRMNAQRAQSPAEHWHDTKWPQSSTITKIEFNLQSNTQQKHQKQQFHPFTGQSNANTLPNSKLRWRSPSPQRRKDVPPLLHRSASSSLAHFALTERPTPSTNFRTFGQRVAGGGAHRQHFERIRDRFEDAEKRNGTERSAEVLWKRAAEKRKGGGESGGKAKLGTNGGESGKEAKLGTNGGVATVFVNGACFGRVHSQKAQPPPLPTSSPPEIRQKTRPFSASPSPCPPREIIRLKTPTNGIDLRDLQNLDGAQLAVLRTDFKFSIDLDGDAEGKQLIRIVRR